MQLLQPLQYQSMFVPTNMGLLNSKLMMKEQEYEQNQNAIASAMDQYAQIPSDPSAIEYKNNLMNSFKGDLNSMIDTYGGDLAAIDKVSLINKLNSIRPQIQQIQRHAALKEEERQLRNKYGAWAYAPESSASSIKYGDQVIGDPIYKIKDKRDYLENLKSNYGSLASRRYEGNLMSVPGHEEYLQTVTQLGLDPNEVNNMTGNAVKSLMDMDKDLEPDEALAMAQSFIPNLVLGQQKQFLKEEGFDNDGNNGITGVYPMIDWANYGIDNSESTKGIKKSLLKNLNARLVDIYADLDNPYNYQGTSARNKIVSVDPISSMYEKAIIKGDAVLQSISNNPFDMVDGVKYENSNYYYNKKTTPTIELLDKYNIDITKDFSSILNKTEADFAGGGPKTKSFSRMLRDNVRDYISIKSKSSNNQDIEEITTNLMTVYYGNQHIYKKKMRESINNIDQTGVLPSNMFDFKTFDMTSKSGKLGYDYINNFVDSGIISPNNIIPLTGDYKDYDKEKLISLYNTKKKKPIIKGIATDDQHGTLFVVEGPEGDDIIAKLNVSKPLEYKIALSMGQFDAIPNDLKLQVFNNIKTGQKIAGYDAKVNKIYSNDNVNNYTANSYNNKGTQTVSLIDPDGNPITVGNIRKLLKERNISNDQLSMKGAKDTDPYQFKSATLMFEILNYLK